MFQVREENKRSVSGVEQGQIVGEIVDSGLVGSSPDERRVFLETCGIDYAHNFQLTAPLPEFLFDVCSLLASQWRLAQFAENFRQLRDEIENKSFPYEEAAIQARAAVCRQHLDSFVAYCKRLPTDMREQLKVIALERMARELGDEP